jgi:hypothetical protein
LWGELTGDHDQTITGYADTTPYFSNNRQLETVCPRKGYGVDSDVWSKQTLNVDTVDQYQIVILHLLETHHETGEDK